MQNKNTYKLEEQIKNEKLTFYKNITATDLLFKIKDCPKKPFLLKNDKFVEKAYNKCFNKHGDIIIDQIGFYFEDDFLSSTVSLEILKRIKKDYDKDVLYFMMYKNDNNLTYFDSLMLLNDPIGMIKDALKFKHRPSIIVQKWIITESLVDCL